MYVDRSAHLPKIDYLNVEQLKKFLTGVPDSAVITVSSNPGDRNEMSYHSLTVRWREQI